MRLSRIALLTMVLLWVPLSHGAPPYSSPKKVLLLPSYKPSVPVAEQWEKGFKSGFAAYSDVEVELSIEYLDVTSNKGADYDDLLVDLLRHDFDASPPDLVIPIYNRAFQFLMANRQKLFPGIPVVFTGIESHMIADRPLEPGVTGVFTSNSYRETLDLALHLQPDTRHVAVVSGAGPIGGVWGRQALENFRAHGGPFDLIDLTGLPVPDLLTRVARLPMHSIVIYLPVLEDGRGTRFVAPAVLEELSRASSAPIYSLWSLMLGHGVVGGYMSSAEGRGRLTAELALRVLNGANPSDIPPVTEAYFQPMFDWREVRRWKIPIDRLPPESVIAFKPETVWSRYKPQIVGILAVIAFQGLIILALLHQRRARSRSDQALRRRIHFETLISDISRNIITAGSNDQERVVGDALQQIAEALDIDRISLFQYSADRTQLKAISFFAKEGAGPPPEILAASEVPWIYRQIDSGETVVFKSVEDLDPAAQTERQLLDRMGIRAGVVIPLTVKDVTIGALSFASLAKAIDWPDSLMNRLRMVADIVANAHMHRLSESAIKSAERKYRMVADFTHSWEYWENIDGSLEYVSPSCERITGFAPSDFIKRPSLLTDIVLPEDKPIWDRRCEDLHTAQSAIEVSFRIQDRSGNVKWIDHTARTICGPGDAPIGYRVSNRDVTESRQVMEFERLTAALSAEFVTIETEQLEEKVEEALFRMGRLLGVDRCFLFRFEPDQTRFRISHMWTAEGIPDDPVVKGELVRDHFPWLSEKLARNEDVIVEAVDGLQNDAGPEYHYCRQFGIQSFLILPISVAQNPLCAIGMDAIRQQRQWNDAIIQRLRTIGLVIANTIARLQADARMRNAFNEIRNLKEQLEAESAYLQEEIKLSHNFKDIIGNSDALRYVLYRVEQVADTNSTVLILGETGTGKELIARAIHNASKRNGRPLVKINCASLPAGLIENELFGREKGAFTGAHSRQAGRFELADGTSLFLDEIGELPFELQAKLLRVIEDGEFERLGGTTTQKVDVRIIAATNRDLEKEVKAGRFREDLWYRLNVYSITLPPLRDRLDDIPLLVQFFTERISKQMGKPITHIPGKYITRLQQHSWPGNVRELKHVIERSIINTKGTVLQLGDVFQSQPAESHYAMDAIKPLMEMERDYITRVLEKVDWVISGKNGAARILGIPPSTLRSKMQKLGIRKNTLAK